MTKKSDAPAIRFKGFSDAWEQRKLSEMCGTFEYGLNAAAKEFDGKNKYIRITDIDDASREFLLSDLSSPDICLDGMSKYLLSSGDIVFARTGASVGKTYIYKENDGIMYFAGFLIRTKVNQDNDAEFVFQSTLSPSYEKYIRITSQRSGQPGVNAQEYGEYDLFAPSKEEQQRIGQFLRGIDNLITLHQRKFEKLTNVKKSMLEKMFPQNGSSYPEIRFKGFTDPWEQRKLGDMMNVTSVKRIHQSDWTDSGVRFLRARDIVAAAKNEEPDDYLYISKEKYEEYSTLSGKVGVSDLLVTGVGTIGVPYLVRNLEPLYFKDGNIIWFQNSDKIDGKFLFYSFSAEQIQGFINESAGIGTVGTYTIESGKKTPISLPNQIEQAKVGEFFQQLDNLITLHQRQPFLQSPPDISLIVQLTPPFYTFSWEQRKFEEIAVRSSVICSDDTLPRVEYEDIVSGTGRLNKDIYAKQSIKSGIAFHQGDVLYGKLRPYLQNWLLPTFDGLAVGDFWVLQPQNADSSFLYRLIQSRQFDEVANQSTGTKMPRADWKLVSKTVFSIPSNISEQAAIGTYFTALDSLITLHQRQTIVYAVIRSIRKVILAERQYFAPPIVRKSP